MQRFWPRFFAEQHVAMLYWLGAVALATVGTTLVVRSGTPQSFLALAAIPLLLVAGLAAALAELVLAWRRHRDDFPALASHVGGTLGLGAFGLPLAAGLVMATLWIADTAALLRNLPAYRQVIADVQHGAIPVSDTWRTTAGVNFTATNSPQTRVVFAVPGIGSRSNSIVYDPSGGATADNPTASTGENSHHRIGGATVVDCHATLVTGYYRCETLELFSD